jgi:hypothetical protein
MVFYRVKYAKTIMLARCKFPQYLTVLKTWRRLVAEAGLCMTLFTNAVNIDVVTTFYVSLTYAYE